MHVLPKYPGFKQVKCVPYSIIWIYNIKIQQPFRNWATWTWTTGDSALLWVWMCYATMTSSIKDVFVQSITGQVIELGKTEKHVCLTSQKCVHELNSGKCQPCEAMSIGEIQSWFTHNALCCLVYNILSHYLLMQGADCLFCEIFYIVMLRWWLTRVTLIRVNKCCLRGCLMYRVFN